LVAGLLIWFWRAGDYPELDLKPSLLGVAAGLVGFLFWVAPEKLLSGIPMIGEASGFDPGSAGEEWRIPLSAVRMIGAVLVVPIFEELFLRSFLLRFVDATEDNSDDFRDLPIGRYRIVSFLVVVAAMALTHHRWIRGGLYSALMCFVLYRSKRMGSVIWAHAITNLLLGTYVLYSGEWSFW
jgi:hypothetical protein